MVPWNLVNRGKRLEESINKRVFRSKRNPLPPPHTPPMAAGSSNRSGRQTLPWFLETIEEFGEQSEEDYSDFLGVRRPSRVSLVKQSTPAQPEETRFTASCSGDSSLSSLPQRAHHSRDPPHGLLPSVQEAVNAPGGPDQSQLPCSPLHPLDPLDERQSERPLRPRGPSAAEISPGEGSPLRKDIDVENKAESRPEPTESKMKKKQRPNRRLSMRSKDGEAPVVPQAKKRIRKPRKDSKMTSPAVPDWLVKLMHSIEEATHHELVVE
ncbi:hypothetical protein SKAU_G00380500 [Synaphobranchus kaupii]|uniref:Uncharacterized protein n=1 Tax=Synaphobranchus kaupii TaxID=118154 RepID=A0A9Q1EDJ7_SYNKA|nr:hypothetical protein SKAU_G00380500 [Synaphobranchus kaupii]